MGIKYLVGIDFGHGETTVSYIDLSKIDEDMNIAKISEKINHLRIVDKVGIDACVIDSVIYRKPHENGSYVYRLQADEGYDICTSFKSKISLLNRPNKKEEKEAFRNFIQLVYKNILENNKSILDQDGKNFLLYIASPTLWSVQDKEEYKRFVEDAIGRKVEWVINESDAAYYQKRQSSGLILVVDFGSSTIDFTLVYNNKKIDIDNLSNIRLGAQNVELQMFSFYTTGINTRNQYLEQKAISEGLLRKENMTYINLYAALLYNLRKRKEEVYSKEGYGRRDKEGKKKSYGFDWRYPFDWEKMEIRCNPYYCYFEGENSLLGSYIQDVKNLFQEVKTVIDQKCAPADVEELQLIVSGGASRMPWVRETLSEVFNIPLETIELRRDDRPEFIVSDGIVKYALAQYRVRQETFSLVCGFKDWLHRFFGNEEVTDINDSIVDEIENSNNIVSLISDVCSDVYVNTIETDEGVLKYCSDTFKDGVKRITIGGKNIDYHNSSLRGFVYHIAKDINTSLLKKERREEVNKAIFEKLKIEIRKELDAQLNDIVFKLFNQNLINCEVLKLDQRVLPDITNDFTIGNDKFEEVAEACIESMGKICTKDGFKILKWKFKGSYNKPRDLLERKQFIEAYCKYIKSAFFEPYNEEEINIIQSKIEEYVFPNIIDIVKNYLIGFYTCGYDLKNDILHDLKLLEQRKAKELAPATEKTL